MAIFTTSVVAGVVVVAPMTGTADVGERSPVDLEFATVIRD